LAFVTIVLLFWFDSVCFSFETKGINKAKIDLIDSLNAAPRGMIQNQSETELILANRLFGSALRT
jgi:hypothetical protein